MMNHSVIMLAHQLCHCDTKVTARDRLSVLPTKVLTHKVQWSHLGARQVIQASATTSTLRRHMGSLF
jgi:hypothetical protein